MKSLIFGINGQDGYYLKRLLNKSGIEVLGVSRSNSEWIKGDVSDLPFVENIIREEKPEYIFHLAANSTTNYSALFENHRTICTGTLNVLDSAYRFSPSSRIFLSGSGLQFVNRGLPIRETDAFDASSPYAVSRIHSAYAARYYRSLGLNVYIGYFFNHDSPLRSERHVNQKIVAAAKRIAGGSSEKIELGDINVKKEFNFAGDMAEAIWILVNNGQGISESVIGCGKAYSIGDWVDICFGHFGLDPKKSVRLNPGFKTEYDTLVSDPATLSSLDWTPKIDFEKLAKIMIENAE